MPQGPAARANIDTTAHPLPPILTPGPGSINVVIGFMPAWRGIPLAAVAAIQAAKTAADTAIQTAVAATAAAAGTPGAPAAYAAELYITGFRFPLIQRQPIILVLEWVVIVVFHNRNLQFNL